jgi:hypothetical protein
MFPDNATSNIAVMTRLIAVTATTLFAFVLQGDGEMLPANYHASNPPLHSEYQWEEEGDQYFISGFPEEFWEHDVFISMPPKNIYSVNLEIEKIVKGKLDIVLPEA